MEGWRWLIQWNGRKGNAFKMINGTEFKQTNIAVQSCSMIKKEGMWLYYLKYICFVTFSGTLLVLENGGRVRLRMFNTYTHITKPRVSKNESRMWSHINTNYTKYAIHRELLQYKNYKYFIILLIILKHKNVSTQ